MRQHIIVQPGQPVHKDCRRTFTNPLLIEKDLKGSVSSEPNDPCTLRSQSPTFDYKSKCLFCTTTVSTTEGRKRCFDVYSVRTVELKATVSKVCQTREDKWSTEVAGRLAFINDLYAEEAVYHQSCVNFRTGKSIPKKFQSEVAKKGRPKSVGMNLGRPHQQLRYETFLEVAKFVEENDDEQISVNDLMNKMIEHLKDTSCTTYSFPYMMTKLKEHFGDRIVITQINGKSNIVTFCSTAKVVLQSFYEQSKEEYTETEAQRIVVTAAKLIRNSIKSVELCNEFYPAQEQLEKTEEALKFLPPILISFLEILMTGKDTDLKLASIGQAIMQACRPRVMIAPLQLGLSTQMHHLFGSLFLVDSLYKHGFGCSYKEVQKFEQNAALQQSGDVSVLNSGKSHVQFIADNVDHDIRALDGHGTFHGMGLVATVTPTLTKVKRITRRAVTLCDVIQVGRIDIKDFTSQHTGKLPLTFAEIRALEVSNPTYNVDILWEVSFLMRPTRPSW